MCLVLRLGAQAYQIYIYIYIYVTQNIMSSVLMGIAFGPDGRRGNMHDTRFKLQLGLQASFTNDADTGLSGMHSSEAC